MLHTKIVIAVAAVKDVSVASMSEHVTMEFFTIS